MPTDPASVIKLHKEFGSIEAIDRQLIQPAIVKAFYQTSPLMSSTESYASRRTEFLSLFQDQLLNGVYKTKTVEVKEPDPITGELKTVSKVDILMDQSGNPTRAETSSFKLYNISMLPATIREVRYDPEVEKQIASQRDAILNVQTAQAAAKKAEQDAITAEKSGEAKAAQARAEQEALKATAVTKAEQDKDVATLQAQQQRDVAKLEQEAAGYTKQQNILLGEGEAERKRLVFSADGALAQKLDAYVRSQEIWASAFKDHQGPLVPSVVMGGSSGSSSAASSVQQLMDMFAVRNAHDLSLDFSTNGGQAKR
jgi:regulator of protease activity HflC (stomatin/prohibitin superfamily)